MNPNYSGIIFAILSPLFSSISTIYQSGATKLLTPLVVVSIGGIIGSILLFIMAKLFREKNIFKKIRSNLKDLIAVVFLRSISGHLLLAIGLSQTTAIKAIFFTKIEVYFVLIFSWLLLKEKIRLKQVILLTIHILGAITLSTSGKFNFESTAQIGDLFIIIAMVFFALSYNFGKKLAHNVGSISGNAASMGLAGLILLPFAYFFSPWENISGATTGWTYLFAYVILFNVIALSMWYASLKSVKGWIVSSLRIIGPVLGAPFAYILFKETLDSIQIIGATIIITTSFLILREHVQSDKHVQDDG